MTWEAISKGAQSVLEAMDRQRIEREREELIRQLWRWAAWACPDGIPPGFKEEERPQ